MFQVGGCDVTKSAQFAVTWQDLLLHCCFSWRISYFWISLLFSETIAFHITTWWKEITCVSLCLTCTAMTTIYKYVYARNYVPHLLWCYKDALEFFSNFSAYLYCDVIFHGKLNFLSKPATNSNFFVSALWNGTEILLSIWDFNKSR